MWVILMSPSWVSVIHAADGCIMSDIDGQRVRWAAYFEQLYKADPLSGQLLTIMLQIVDGDPPTGKTSPSLDEIR